MKKNQISVVIPNWNGENFLKICLPSLTGQTERGFEVLIVDNNSSDNSINYIQRNFPKFKVIPLSKNFGFARAVNEGIKKANGEYVVLINNDSKIDSNCLFYLQRAAQAHPEVGFISAKILSLKKKGLIDNAGDNIDASGHLIIRGHNQKDHPQFNKEGYCFLASGGGSLIKKEVFKKIGYFDEDFFMYMEDADFFFRAQLAGFKGWFQPKAVIYHIGKGTSSKNLAMVEIQNFRNMTMTIIKNFPLKLLLSDLNFIKIFLVNLNTIIYLSKKGYLFQAIKTELEVFFKLPILLKKRLKVQSLKKVSDGYIIENVLKKSFHSSK